MRERNITEEQVAFAFAFGRKHYSAKAEWRTVELRDIPKSERSEDRIRKYVGLVVCIKGGTIATVYRHDRPSFHIRSKDKRPSRGMRYRAA